MNSRYGSLEEHERFSAFLKESKRPKSLDDINFSSPVLVQVITYHLYNEYLVENWVNHKFAKGISIFSGAIFTTKSKIIFAKNIGLPEEIFKAVTLLNSVMNKLAHNINVEPIDDGTLQKSIKAMDNIGLDKDTYAALYPYQKDKIESLSGDAKIRYILHFILSTMSLKIWSYLFNDMFMITTHEK